MSVILTQLHVELWPEAAISDELLLQSSTAAVLSFNAIARRTPERTLASARKAILTFTDVAITKFGFPNDEAQDEHPLLAGPGYAGYGMYVVQGSPWRDECQAQERAIYPMADWSDLTHYILSLRDTTFECLAGGYEVELFKGELEAVLQRMTEILIAASYAG